MDQRWSDIEVECVLSSNADDKVNNPEIDHTQNGTSALDEPHLIKNIEATRGQTNQGSSTLGLKLMTLTKRRKNNPSTII